VNRTSYICKNDTGLLHYHRCFLEAHYNAMYVNLQQLSVIDSKVMPSFYKTFQTVCYIILNNITSLTLVCTTDPKNIASLTYVCTSDPKNTTILTKVGIHEMLT